MRFDDHRRGVRLSSASTFMRRLLAFNEAGRRVLLAGVEPVYRAARARVGATAA